MARLSQEANVGYVAISGGEPFLRPDLPEIVRSLADLGIQTTIITNGTLIQDRILRRLPAETAFEVTLFSTDQTTHHTMAGRPCFQRVLDSINLLDRRKRPFILAVVLTRRNMRGTADTIRLGLALGASGVMLNRVNLTGRTLAAADQLLPSVSELEEGLGEADRVAARYGAAVVASVPIPPCVLEVAAFRHINFGWCPRGGPRSYYTMSWDGTLRPCNHSSLILGDLKRSSFSSLTQSTTCQDYWAPIPLECQSCRHPLRDQCRGGCPAAAYECFGSAYRLDPFVELRGRPGGREHLAMGEASRGRPRDSDRQERD